MIQMPRVSEFFTDCQVVDLKKGTQRTDTVLYSIRWATFISKLALGHRGYKKASKDCRQGFWTLTQSTVHAAVFWKSVKLFD